MRPRIAHQQNSAFIRSSSLGAASAKPVIKKVTVRRGKGAERVIVKDDVISSQNISFRVYDEVTFSADIRLASRTPGYFYATITTTSGHQALLFAKPLEISATYPVVILTHTMKLRTQIKDLNFHISPTIPSTLDPTYLDPQSRQMLRTNPSAYSSLGFIPTEPELSSPSSDFWDGEVNNHDWDYGRTGTAITPREEVKWHANYDAGWLATASVYQYVKGSGWQPFQQNTVNVQVGQPLCIVGQMVRYENTLGMGGEYHYYNTPPMPDMFNVAANITGAEFGVKMPKENIRFVHKGWLGANEKTYSKWYNKNKHSIQKRGGEVNLNFDGAGFWLIDEKADKFCAKVEWWNPKTNTWSVPMVHPDYDAKFNGEGKFVYYFRFPRQLNEKDEFYNITPQWQIGKTWNCYPYVDADKGSPSYKDVAYKRIGRPNVNGTQAGLAIEKNGFRLLSSNQSPQYSILLCPPAQSDDGDRRQKERFIPAAGAVSFAATDPFMFSYADNPDITNAYWVNGNFQPGGSFMLLGKALDFFDAFWISRNSLKTKNETPMDLRNNQRDLTRGNHEPNEFTADMISYKGIKKFKLTDIDKPDKTSEFLPFWNACFPGVPLTKEILIAVLRGDQLPDLGNIENTKISGFLEDDPLRYEVDYNGVKFRHSYTIAYCQIPEGWWGPTIVGDDTPFSSVYIGGNNHYFYVHEEQVNLINEIEEQKKKEEAGATPVEAFADSELENPMLDITYEAYKNRNDTVEENVNAEFNKATGKDKNWFFRTELVKLKHKKFSLLGSVGQVSDVTEKYSADHVTSLDGLSRTNTAQYGFNDLFLVEGLGNTPSIVLTPPNEPEGGLPVKHSNVSGFGNSERQALKARALGYGNPMKYSTESKQTSLKTDQLGGKLNEFIDGAEETVKTAATTAAIGLAGLAALGFIIKLGPALRKRRIAKNREDESEIRLAMSEIDLQRKLEE